MRWPRLRTLLLVPALLFALLYFAAALFLALRESPPLPPATAAMPRVVLIFGASGTAGDGILEAALATPAIREIRVVTRRLTPRIESGITAGQVKATLHGDYLDYSALQEQLADADAVFWAIGTSAVGMDEADYARIHVDFPLRFLAEWLRASTRPAASFHYISSSDIGPDASMMWARQKYRAEQELKALAAGSAIRVLLYRPDYIRPTAAERHLGQDALYWFFRPVGAAVEAGEIGRAMIAAAARADEFGHGAILGTRKIVRYGTDAGGERQAGSSR